MSRLIDADELKNKLRTEQRWIVKRDEYTNEGFSFDQVMFTIDRIPTVDAVEVVRCRECKYWEAIETLIGFDCVCTAQGDMNVSKDENDYCSWGERRTE